MKKRWLTFIVGVTACASTDAVLGGYEPPPDEAPVRVDAAPDADAAPAEADAEAGACVEDCEFFPEVCTDGVLCPNGPFDPSTSGGSFEMRTEVRVIRGRSASDVWAAGTLGALAHFDGTSWTRSDAGSRESMLGLWLRDSSEVAVGVFNNAERPWVYARGSDVPDTGKPPSAGGWTVSWPSPPPNFWDSVDVHSAWAGPGGEWLWLATGMKSGNTSTSGLLRLRQSPSAMFEVGRGPASTCTPGCNRMTSVHGVSASELWAVGANGATIRITAADSETPSATVHDSRTWNTLNGVWAASAAEAWSVGAGGTVRHYAGQGLDWDIVPNVPTIVELNAVWGTSPSDIWAVGEAGVVLHYDGKTWSRVKVAGLGVRRPNLTTVWAPAPGHVWVGGQGVFLSLGGKP